MLTFRGNREPENVLACQRSLEISPVATQRMHGRTLQGLILICQCTHSSSMYIIRYFVPMGPLAFHNSCVQGQRSHTITDIPAQFLLKKKCWHCTFLQTMNMLNFYISLVSCAHFFNKDITSRLHVIFKERWLHLQIIFVSAKLLDVLYNRMLGHFFSHISADRSRQPKYELYRTLPNCFLSLNLTRP